MCLVHVAHRWVLAAGVKSIAGERTEGWKLAWSSWCRNFCIAPEMGLGETRPAIPYVENMEGGKRI